MVEKTMEKIVALAKSRGFVYPGSEIYGGLANTWDYGNLGVELKNNVKKAWWQKFVQESPYYVGVDCAILMNPQTWVASGHLGGFSDPLMDCKECHERFRADKMIEDYAKENGLELPDSIDGWSHEKMEAYIEEHQIPCPTCGKHNFTEIREFNLMFKTFQGVTEDAKSVVYLRPETAQGIFVNFKNVQRTSRKKIPFGICQIGKSFRNEITPGNFTFRTREFEQMELEFFCEPDTDLEWHAYWKQFCLDWLKSLGLKDEEVYPPSELVVPRPPALCKGCGHRDMYAALNEVLREYENSRVFSDIGCYTLGFLPPYRAIHSVVDMGASITMAKGAADAGQFPSVAVIGDSTFTHSGMTGLLDAVNENSNITIVISDNLTTGMTGGQDSAGTGRLEQICQGIGVAPEHIRVVVPLPKNMEEMKNIIREEIEYCGVSVIIPRRECIQTARRHSKQKKQ